MAIIYLGLKLLSVSSGLPKIAIPRDNSSEQLYFSNGETIFLLDLASGVVYRASEITFRAVSSYLAFSPLPQQCRGGIFSVVLSVIPLRAVAQIYFCQPELVSGSNFG